MRCVIVMMGNSSGIQCRTPGIGAKAHSHKLLKVKAKVKVLIRPLNIETLGILSKGEVGEPLTFTNEASREKLIMLWTSSKSEIEMFAFPSTDVTCSLQQFHIDKTYLNKFNMYLLLSTYREPSNAFKFG